MTKKKFNVESFIAWRFLRRGVSGARFSPMTFFAWLAIGVGVGAMSTLLSVMYGFESSLKEKVLKAYPHILVRPKEQNVPIKQHEAWTGTFQGVPGVVRVLPFVETEMLGQSGERTLGVVVRGVSLEEFKNMQPDFASGKLPRANASTPQVVVGAELAVRLALAEGDPLKIVSPVGTGGAMGLIPRSETYEVAATYRSGHYEFDQQYIFLLIEDAQDLLKWGNAISGWQIWVKDSADSTRIAEKLQKSVPSALQVEGWETFNSALFHSLKLEQYSMFLILSFAILIAVMNVVITLIMHVTNKRVNIGILRALGASKVQVERIFLYQGAYLGGIGMLLGACLTLVLLFALRTLPIYQLPAIYYDRSIPVEVRPMSLLLIYGIAAVLVFLGVVYPARKAASINPIEAIKK